MMWLTTLFQGNKMRPNAKMPDDAVNYVLLADGRLVAVPCANLAAAKELLAMQKIAQRHAPATRTVTPRLPAPRGEELELAG
jgi:hypothetical protein